MSITRLIDESHIQFDEDKFFDVVHLICHRFCDEPDRLGQVKLHKILYFSDMQNFLSTGKPLTGVDYQKQPFGPTARHLGKALRKLQAEGKLAISKRDYFGYPKIDFSSLEAPSTNRLSPEEVALIDTVCDWIGRMTASEASEISHDEPWREAGMGERIPYATASWLLPQPRVSGAAIQWANETADSLKAAGTHE